MARIVVFVCIVMATSLLAGCGAETSAQIRTPLQPAPVASFVSAQGLRSSGASASAHTA